jgi:CubicO group peptidase (beta-lactamase class C family)
MRKIVSRLLFLLCACIALFSCKNHYLLKGLGDTYFKFRNTPRITGYHLYHNGVVKTGTPLPWNISKNYNKVMMPDSGMKFLEETKSAAFLVIKNDSICYEHYFKGYADTSHTNSWSMSKSITSLLIGVAINERKIKSVDEKVSDFIPSYTIGVDTLLTIKHLLTMSSGIGFGESYSNPFGYPAKALYGNNLLWLTEKYHCKEKPGTNWLYQSGNTVLLAAILAKATGETLSDYASEKLWKPLGAEYPAFWSLDHKGGIEKAFCCFYSNARDFARIGKLMMDSGKFNGKQIVPKEYVLSSIMGQRVKFYGYQWWIGSYAKHKLFWAEGFSGQFIIVIPDKNLIVVRLGQKDRNGDGDMYTGLAMKMFGN